VCEVADKDGSGPSQVGSLVLNLADYAEAEGVAKKLPVAVATAISAACGQPQLGVSIRRAPLPPLSPRVVLFPPRQCCAHPPPSMRHLQGASSVAGSQAGSVAGRRVASRIMSRRALTR